MCYLVPRAVAACGGLGRASTGCVLISNSTIAGEHHQLSGNRALWFANCQAWCTNCRPSPWSVTLTWSWVDLAGHHQMSYLVCFGYLNIKNYISLHVIQWQITFSGLGWKILQEAEPELQRYWTVSLSTENSHRRLQCLVTESTGYHLCGYWQCTMH